MDWSYLWSHQTNSVYRTYPASRKSVYLRSLEFYFQSILLYLDTFVTEKLNVVTLKTKAPSATFLLLLQRLNKHFLVIQLFILKNSKICDFLVFLVPLISTPQQVYLQNHSFQLKLKCVVCDLLNPGHLLPTTVKDESTVLLLESSSPSLDLVCHHVDFDCFLQFADLPNKLSAPSFVTV